MFQKHSIMSLKKKSKSLGHLTALGSYPCSPDVEPKVTLNSIFPHSNIGLRRAFSSLMSEPNFINIILLKSDYVG